MKRLSTHDQIKIQIAAFLFNNRADALRTEMYSAICLYVLNEIEGAAAFTEIVEAVAYAIDPEAKKSDSLATIVSDTLHTLVKDGYVRQIGDKFSIIEKQSQDLPDMATYEKVDRDVLDEVKKIALSMQPLLTPSQIDQIYSFYKSVCAQLAEKQLGLIVKGQEVNEPNVYNDTIKQVVSSTEIEFPIKEFIDRDQFIRRTIIAPDALLAQYLVLLIQVNVIFKSLTWDPDLEFLRSAALANKTLYLDTSALFVLMLEHSSSHNFFRNLIKSSVNELKVGMKIHRTTIDEYEAVVNYKTESFISDQRYIRQLVRLYKKDQGDLTEGGA